eukprot:554511-Amorphochlora_amoeboformis.AAC.1
MIWRLSEFPDTLVSTHEYQMIESHGISRRFWDVHSKNMTISRCLIKCTIDSCADRSIYVADEYYRGLLVY